MQDLPKRDLACWRVLNVPMSCAALRISKSLFLLVVVLLSPLDYVHLSESTRLSLLQVKEEGIMQELLALALAAGAAASPFEKSKWHFEGKPHGWYVEPGRR
jgi:hypothetical protein